MQLICDQTVALAYKSASQRARVISESWFGENAYCLACSSESLNRSAPNTVATDFSCDSCGHLYELKTFLQRPFKSLVDGAYASLMRRITANAAPTLCLLERNENWVVTSLTAIHSSFLTPFVVEQRRPLGPSARRAG
ncbi:MAG TPA: DpnI domain-containing protein, partial [Acidobacteriaceae bacterium]|nr:DpnI domain-containing protein [Acidobacteriaceae bacterium]